MILMDNVKIKVCTRCKRKLTLDMFRKRKDSKDGLVSCCKECMSEKYYEKRIEKRIEKGIIIMIPGKGMKICSKCKKELTLDMFSKKISSTKDGLELCCKKCKSESSKKSRDKYPDKEKQRCKKYNKENRDKITIQKKKYYEENKDKRLKYLEENSEKFSKYNIQYYEKNIDKIKKREKKYAQNNKDKFCIKTQKRNARKLLLASTFTLEQWKQCKNYFSDRCCYCGQKLKLAMEHLIPVAKGGSYNQQNIVPACGSCNSSKGTKPFHSWYESYKFYSKERESKILEYLEAVN